MSTCGTRGEFGATGSEYALLISRIAAVIFTAVYFFGENILALFESFPASSLAHG